MSQVMIFAVVPLISLRAIRVKFDSLNARHTLKQLLPRIYFQAAVQLDKPTRRRPLVAKALLLFCMGVVLFLGDVRCQ